MASIFEHNNLALLLIFVSMVALLLSVGINLYWFSLKKNQDKQQGEHAETLGGAQAHNSNIILSFLERQIAETKAFLQPDPDLRLPNLNKKTIALRTAYLNIERRGLGYGESTCEYWDYLNRRILKLLETFMPQLFGRDSQIQELENRVSLLKQRIKALAGKSTPTSAKTAIETLDAFLAQNSEVVENQPDIAGYLRKMENSVLAFEDPESRKLHRYSSEAQRYATSSIDILNKLQQELENQSQNIEALESDVCMPIFDEDAGDRPQHLLDEYNELKRELDSKKADNEKLKQRIAGLKKTISEYEKQAKQYSKKSMLTIGEDGKLGNTRDSVKEIHNLSKKISLQTNQEIKRLRSLLGRQSSSINSLESQVDSLRDNLQLGDDASEDKDILIEKLRCNILNSELCVNTLEQQVEELRKQIDTIRASDSSTASQSDMECLNKELQAFKSELDQVMSGKILKENVLDYIREALEASSLEDLAVMMFHNLNELGCEPAIEIKYVDKTLCVSGSGKMSRQDRLLVENMQINEIDAGEKDNALKFRMLHLRGVLRSCSGATEAFVENKKQLIEMVQATDKLIEKVGATQLFKNQKKQLELCQNTIKKVAFEVDQRFNLHAKRAKDVMSSSVGQLQDIAQSAGLEKNKIDAFSKVQDQSLKELEVDKAMRIKTRESFLELIRSLGGL